MKKTLVFAFLITSLSFPVFSNVKNQGQIQALQGEVQFFEKEGASSQAAKVGMTVISSNIIETGNHAYCVIQLDEQNSLRIKQNARVKIEKIWEASKKPDGSVVNEARLDLMRGELTAKLNKIPANSKFEVSSPVAIAGATGTAYTVYVEPENSKTSVTVLDHQVEVINTNESGKSVQVQKFQRVETAPWAQTTVSALGRGVLSEAILGKDFVKQAENNIEIQSVGTGTNPEEAKLQALYQLSKIILNLHVDQEKTLEKVMAEDLILTQKVYQMISNAQIVESTTADGKSQSKAKIDLVSLNQALGKSLFGLTQSVIPISQSEYSKKFSALARVTTVRAAQVEGYRNLAEIIYGTVINADTTVEDFAVKNDTVRTKVQGLVKGAQVINTQYFSDGSVIVSLEIRGDLIPENLSSVTGDVFGKNYLSGPRLIEYREFIDLDF